MVIARVPESDGHAARAATGFEQPRLAVGKIPVDENFLRLPQPEKMRRPRVVDDRAHVVEIGAHDIAGDFGRRFVHVVG